MPAPLISRYIRKRDEAAIKAPQHEVSDRDRQKLFERFGENPHAFPVLTEAELQTFGDAKGMIAYDRKMGSVFALADPLASPANTPALLDAFIATFGDPAFAACSEHTARALGDRGYFVNVLGHNTVIDLTTFRFSGGAQKRLRYSMSWLEGRGAIVTESPERPITPQSIRDVSRAWHETRVANREISFLNRKLSVKPHPRVRRFLALADDGAVIGFLEFDPVFREEKLIGYLASSKRRVPDDTTYLDLAIMGHAIRCFQAEGVSELHLGLSPLAEVSPPEFGRECRWLRRASAYAFKSGWANRRLFSFQGLAEYKQRFRGTREPLYLCLPQHGSNVMRMAAFLILTKIV